METNQKHTLKKTFPVVGMSCASCASSAQTILEHQAGVIHAAVNYANATALVEYNEQTNPQTLKTALQSIGYDLVIEDTDSAQADLEEHHQKKIKTLKQKTIGAVLFSVPIVAIAMIPALMHLPYANYIMWVLATPVVLIFGKQFFTGAIKQAKHGTANMDTLVALSTGIAYLFSVFNTLFSQIWHNKGLHAHVYFEASAVVIAFILLGKLLEEKAKGSTSSAIKKLMGLQPKTVTVMRANGIQIELPIAEIKVGDIILVKPSEKIAVDGVVVSGSSYVDESMLSGEPIPLEKKANANVFAGTINQKGSFQFKASKVGADTLLAQIIKMVQEAQGSKAPVQKLVDKIASIFVPIVMLLAIISLLVWSVFGGENGLTHGLLAMVTILVIACPCALGLATPTAIMVGMGKGAEKGILIKDAQSLELTKKVNAVVLDKTGTLTEGKPEITHMYWAIEEQDELRNILFSIEQSSEHPLAHAVVQYFSQKASFLQNVTIENISGQGIRGSHNNRNYFIGNMPLALSKNIEIDEKAKHWITTKSDDANTVVLFFNETHLIAAIAIADKLKPTSAKAIQDLQENGIEVYMLTGDNEQTANAVAKQIGIHHFKANVLPSEKSDFIKNIQQQGKIVAMVGDGINDSSALAQADVSIAMGKGSDIAMDVAKMTIISSDLTKIMQAINLSKFTVATIKQNLFWAFIYNVIGIPIAAGILYPINGFLLNPMLAGAAMALSSVSVVSNSLRLKFR